MEQNALRAVVFLNKLAIEREKYPEIADVKTYAYLTTTNLNEKTAPLLKRCGIDVVYVGIESFDPEQWKLQNKPNNPNSVKRALDAAKGHNIKIRTSFVLGINTSKESLQKEIDGFSKVLEKYPDVFLTVGIHPVEVIPGSRDFDNFRLENEKLYKSEETAEIYNHFSTKGFLTRDQQVSLTRAFIEWRSKIHALEEIDPDFKLRFEFYVGVKKPKRVIKEEIKKEGSSTKSPEFNQSELGQYLEEKLRFANKNSLGLSYEEVEASAQELKRIAEKHGVAGYSLESGDLTNQ